MLEQLRVLHDEVVAHIGVLEAEAAQPTPRLDAVAAARLRLTRASRRRTNLLEARIYPYLLACVPPTEQSAVRELRDSGKALLAASVGHIGRWTIRDVGERWVDYRKASHAMRVSMLARVEAERALLYPLLTRWPEA